MHPHGHNHAVEQLDLFKALERGMRAEERRDQQRAYFAERAKKKRAKAQANAKANAQALAYSRAALKRVSEQEGDPPW